MSLLLKSLRRIDSRNLPIEAEIAEPIAAASETAIAVPVAKPPELPIESTPMLPEVTADGEVEDDHALIEEIVGDVFDPVEFPSQTIESIPLDALFDMPIQTLAISAIVDAPLFDSLPAEPSPPALVMTATVNETATDELPIVSLPELNIESVLEEISNLEDLLSTEIESPPVVAVLETPAVVAPPVPQPASMPQSKSPRPLKLSDEYRDLRDHLLSRFSIQSHTALLLVDAGRTATDASWVMPLVASLLEQLSSQTGSTPTALLIEAAGNSCGLAKSLGLAVTTGLSEVLRGDVTWNSAVLPTVDSQIQLLGRGTASLPASNGTELASLMSALKSQFDLLLICGGPLDLESNGQPVKNSAASTFLPLANAAILCVELDGTPQKLAVAAKRRLAQSGVNLLGCLVRGDAAAA